MKKTLFVSSLILIFGISIEGIAQTNPGNPKHQWTFDDGTATDLLGGADGTIASPATFSGKALNTTSGGHLGLPAATIAVNTYTALTQEVWFTPSLNANTNNTAITYFGDAKISGWMPANYLSVTPTRYDNQSRTAISCLNTTNPWSAEAFVNGTKFDDGLLHHFVSVIDNINISFYIDGVFVGSTLLSVNNQLSNLSNAFAYICKSENTYEATWKGKVHKFTIFDKALDASEVLYLYREGSEDDPAINVNTTQALIENTQPMELKITGFNLNVGENIIVSAPSGLGLSTNLLPYNADKASLTLIWDGSTAVDGHITFTSGATVLQIPVKTASSDLSCFMPLYNDRQNLISDPKMYNVASFSGWGTKEIITITSDPTNVYCGISSAKVGNGSATSGSLEVVLNGKVNPNTSYRVKAMVKTIGGDFQLGIWGLTDSQIQNNINTNGEWQTIDFVFKTASTLQPNQYMWWNNSGLTGTLGFIDNWEMYNVSDILSDEKILLGTDMKVFVKDNSIIANVNVQTAGIAKIEVYNLQGININTEKAYCNIGFNHLTIAQELPTGIYFVKLNIAGEVLTCKLVK